MTNTDKTSNSLDIQDTFEKQLDRWRRFIDQFFLNVVVPRVKPEMSVLDIGIGESTNLCRAHFPKFSTLDSRNDAQPTYHVDITDPKVIDLVPRQDVILIMEVLEHVKKPWLAAQHINRLCKPNGMIVVTVPSFLAWHPMQPICGDYWRFLDGHVEHLFGQSPREKAICPSDQKHKPIGMCYIL